MNAPFYFFKINRLNSWRHVPFIGIMLLMILNRTAYAQTPGGVATGLGIWLKANAGTTTSGLNLTGWANQSTSAIPVTVIGSPDLVSAGYNFNPYINFTLSSPTGGDYLRIPNTNFQTFFWVAQLTNTARGATHLATFDNVTAGQPCPGCPLHGGTNGGTVAQYEELGYGRAAFQATNTWRRNGNSTPYNTTHSGQFNIVSALGSTVVPTNVFLGGQISNSSGFDGRTRDWLGPVGEVIAYSGSVTVAEANKIESYLAIKYGITLGNNGSVNTAYTSPSGLTLWAQNTGYHYDVAGIGRDMISEGLDQPKSTSINTPSDVVSMANSNYATPTSLTADGDYLIWGHNNGSVTAFSTCQNFTHQAPATSIITTWGRVWRTQKTGNPTGNLIIEIDMNACQGPTGAGSNSNATIRLLIDDNTAFNDASAGEYTYSPNPGFAATGGKLYFSVPYNTIQNGTGFFTIAASGVVPDVSPKANIALCEGFPAAATSFTGSVAGTTFSWTNSNTAIGLPANGTGNLPAFTALNGGTAPITGIITVTPSLTCPGTPMSFSITITPTVTPSATISASQTTICIGTPVTFTANTLNGGSLPNYQWLLNGAATGNSTNTYSSSTLQNGDVISLSFTSNVTCPTASISVSNSITMSVINPVPVVSAEPNLVFCTGATVPLNTFTANVAGTVFNWSNSEPSIGLAASGAGDLPSFTAINTTAAPVTGVITVTPGVVCIGAPVSFSITVNPAVIPSATIAASETTICVGTAVTLTATTVNGGTGPGYQWLLNGNPVGSGTTTYASSALRNGDLIGFTFTSNAVCATPSVVTSNVITMSVNPIPVAEFNFLPSQPTTANPSVNFFDLSINAVQWLWDFGPSSTSTAQNPVYLFPGAGTYSITLTANNGACHSAVTHTLYIESEASYYIPNTFTPNGDELNDVFTIVGRGISGEDFELIIFNRWGEAIFETNDLQKGWDGNVKGKQVSDDVYSYKIRFKMKDTGLIISKIGSLTVLR